MIIFRSIRYKNFLASGEQWTEIAFDRSPTTLITGKSGAGKTTLIDALCFALYNKAFRAISKPQLVNSINKKHCEVQIDLESNGKEYKIVRGISPNIFEIYEDGDLMNQEAASRDYQNTLEQQILKMNETSFRQIVVLGSRSYVPFMQLTAGKRREVTEEALDIGIFSDMNIVVKENVAKLKAQRVEVERDISNNNQKLEIHKDYITKTKERQDGEVGSLKDHITKVEAVCKKLEGGIEKLDANIKVCADKITDLSTHKKTREKYITQRAKLETLEETESKTKEFFEANDTCNTCKQDISDEYKSSIIETSDKRSKKIKEKHDEVHESLIELNSKISEMNGYATKLQEYTSKKNTYSTQLKTYNSDIIATSNKIKEKKVAEKQDLQSETAVISTLEHAIDKLKDDRVKIDTNLQYNIYMLSMFKDNGVKSLIIKDYLPVINEMLNKHLNDLGLSIAFELDENFNETFKSRYRDKFKYENFSQGEQLRIDLAFVFTWREIAKMKNSVNTNIIIMDEVLDSSLDAESSENFLDVMTKVLEDTNVFVISHKESIGEHFRSNITFEKVEGFSIMV